MLDSAQGHWKTMVNFEPNSNYQYHLSSSVKSEKILINICWYQLEKHLERWDDSLVIYLIVKYSEDLEKKSEYKL
jgi:hypothetical protein